MQKSSVRKSLVVLASVVVVGGSAGVAAAQPSAATAPDGARFSAACRGVTWVVGTHETERALSLIGSDINTDSYQGDTSCQESLPLLCLKKQDLPVPPGINPDFYHGWTGGTAKLTPPIQGWALTSRAEGDRICRSNFGAGYVMGEHHQGNGGWQWWAYSDGLQVWATHPYESPTAMSQSPHYTWSVLNSTWGATSMAFGPDYASAKKARGKHPALCIKKAPGNRTPFEARLSSWVAEPFVNNVCSTEFGDEWILADDTMLDAQKRLTLPTQGARMWSSVDDQPSNPWNYIK
ncbi:hypothetical protein KEM60_00819 [Austwickia sp. TVS 96-490-7B]|uniref:hypothetical protein n=1 Tax=Austwickia sp. TVS 96-490-7B TaxID=2830843 RepID=UPI001C59AC6C|nr:hypothetical protein [Austwickia sp. TVS 96-490-7B]MBW3084630.1 hypothetical protein [Austwickia sp. TVS 96-490-7B]